MANKPNCYKCKYRGTFPGDAHSCCRHPDALGTEDPVHVFMKTAGGMFETHPGIEALGIKGNPIGIRNGCFLWPTNFDPTWLLSCDGFEEKESNG